MKELKLHFDQLLASWTLRAFQEEEEIQEKLYFPDDYDKKQAK